MKVLIPAAGLGQRFRDAGYTVPKPLIFVEDRRTGKPRTIIELVASTFSEHRVFVGTRPEDYEFFRKVLPKEWHFMPVPRWRLGQSASILTLLEQARDDEMVAICNSDVYHDININGVVAKTALDEASFACVTFQSSEPCYSYVDSPGRFRYAAEKKVISEDAISGLYYGRAGAIRRALLTQVLHSEDEELYFSGAMSGINGNKTAIRVDRALIHDLGTPEKLRESAVAKEYLDANY